MTDRLIELLRRLRAGLDRRLTGRTRRILIWVAVVVFVVGGVVALRSLDIDRTRISWTPLVIAAVVGVPLTAVVNAFEYVVTARIVDRRVGAVAALRISVLSTAANMLPIPGAALVRIRALRELGPGYRSATSATIVVGLTWIGVSASMAGGWLTAVGWPARGVPFLAVGIALLTVAWTVLRRSVGGAERRQRLAAAALGIEVISVASSAFRIVLVLTGLGLEPTVAAGLVLAVSGSMAAAAGIFPAGLGIRELIATALAPVAGLPAAAGFAASAVNRVLGILVHAPIAAALSFTVPDGTRPAGTPTDRDADDRSAPTRRP